jgi:hypothetical protein
MSWRLKLEEVTCEVTPARVRARVELRISGLAHVGLATSPAGAGWEEVVAQATLNAVRMFARFAGASAKLVLDSVRTVSEPRAFVVVAVTMEANGEQLYLVGSAPIEDDPNRAVAQAVLQALNRQIEKMTPPDLDTPTARGH